eukprot:1137810-Pelagomonas_calceolata.AAC.5
MHPMSRAGAALVNTATPQATQTNTSFLDGVGVALAHHDAAHSDKWGSREAILLCTQQGGDGHVTACA